MTNNANVFMQKLAQLKQSFTGDPNKKIQELLNSGKVTQQQYDQAVRQAQQIKKMFGM